MIKKVLTLGCVSLAMVGLASFAVAEPVPVQAQSAKELACRGAGGVWQGDKCMVGGQDSDITPLAQSIINLLLALIGVVAVIMLVIGGFRYVVSAGDSNAIEGAKNTILYAIIGIVVAFLSYAAVNTVISRLI